MAAPTPAVVYLQDVAPKEDLPVDAEAGMTPETDADDAQCSPPAPAEASARQALLAGWRKENTQLSLEEVNGTMPVPGPGAAWWAKLAAFVGVGFMVSVGYSDPGNWATNLAAGSSSGYLLLVAVLLSNMAAIFLQALCLKLGVVAERDLAQACRDAYPRSAAIILWLLAEVAIVATDLAEVIGSATALYLLFGLPLWAGCLITVVDVIFVVFFGLKNFRMLEIFVIALLAVIFGCFTYELAVADPNWGQVAAGYIPKARVVTDTTNLYNAIGILGATVMPHNLYLHSSIIQTRAYPRTLAGKRMARKYGTIDSTLSLLCAFFINSAILILSAAAFFYTPGHTAAVEYLTDAYKLLSPALGNGAAKTIFAIALLASGQNSTVTGTLSGQIVMEGFVNIRLAPWLRRLVTRLLAVVPAAVVAGVMGNAGAGRLLVLSQVILSLTLTPAVVAVMHLTSSRSRMGRFANSWPVMVVGWLLALVIGGLNVFLVVQSIRENSFGGSTGV